MKTTQWFTGASGNAIAADISGPVSGRPVMLLHGGGQTRHSWSRAHDALAERGYRVISLDARGHGESQWLADGDYSLQAQMDDLLAVIGTLPAPAVLIGASMGGVHSLVACAEYPGIATALVLVDVTPQLEPKGIAHILDFMTRHADGFASLEEASLAVDAYNPNRAKRTETKGLEKNLRLRDNGRWYWHWDPRFISGDHSKRVALVSARMQNAAGRIDIPTLLVRGQQSEVVSLEGVEALKALIPQLEFVDVEGAGHMVAGDRNDAFNAAILAFLERHSPTPLT